MRPVSFERRLSLVLAAAITTVAVVAAGSSFLMNYLEAKQFQDDTLRQVGALGATTQVATESPITVIREPTDTPPAWLPANLSPGFHTVRGPAGAMRVFVNDPPGKERIIVIQDTDVIDDVAFGSAVETFVPVLLLIPLVAWLSLRMLAAERRNIERQRRFIADAAHELRSPLTALSIQAQNVESASSLAIVQERIAALRDGIERAQRITAQMLTLAHVQSMPQADSSVDLAALAREVIADSLPQATRRGIDLGLDERAQPQVRGSTESVRLIVKNGVENALRYTPAGGVVTVRVTEEGSEALVEVEDDGPGIAPEHREQAFEPFRRLHPSGDGAGLGLAIARDAATKLGAAVRLDSPRSGRGLLFIYRQRKVR